jgi:tRNA-dihydrouridine synthase
MYNINIILILYCDVQYYLWIILALNCGRWAIQEGYGACLLRHPELLCDMVRQTRSRVNDPDFSVSIKIRLHSDLRQVQLFSNEHPRTF